MSKKSIKKMAKAKPAAKEEKGEENAYKKGGAVTHKVHGTSPKARLDKKARGGCTGSPLSGAAPKGLGD